MSSSVLYDTPGPRAKRRTFFGGGVAGLAILAVLALVIMRLAEKGQFSKQNWSSLLDPNDSLFDGVWTTLIDGAVNTLQAAFFAILLSLAVGTLLAVARLVAAPWWRWAVVGVIELLRGVPVVITIFFVWRVLPVLGLDLATMWDLVIGLTLYNSVIIAEIVRAGILSLPDGQREAAESLGLRRWQVLVHVQLPQAFRVMLPALISQLVVVLKDTSLGYIITYPELVFAGDVLVQNLGNPLQVYFLIAVAFVVVNYSLSKLAVYLERRLGRSKKAAAPEAEQAAMAEAETSGA